MDIKPDYEVNDEEALLNLISKIVKEYAQKMQANNGLHFLVSR